MSRNNHFVVSGSNPDEWQFLPPGEAKIAKRSQQDHQQRIQAIQAMQTQSQPIQSHSPADLMPPPTAQRINPNYAQSHKVTEKTDPNVKANAFLKSFLYGIVPFYALLSFGIVFFVTGGLYISISIIIMAALSSATWLGYQYLYLSHSVDGVERLRINSDAKVQRQAISASADLAKHKINAEMQLRQRELEIKTAMLTGNLEVLNRE